ncbi:MAG: hypothetical protein SGBAC_009969 [Bacillariaceae sp.]
MPYDGGWNTFSDMSSVLHADYISGSDENKLQSILDNCRTESTSAAPDSFCEQFLTFQGGPKRSDESICNFGDPGEDGDEPDEDEEPDDDEGSDGDEPDEDEESVEGESSEGDEPDEESVDEESSEDDEPDEDEDSVETESLDGDEPDNEPEHED